MSTASTNVCTPQYAAPKQFFGQHDHRADIYSLGLVLYELSNQNRLPFAASSYILPDDVQRRYSGEPLPPPCNAGGDLAEAILKACVFNPEERFQTALEFLTALRQVSLNSGSQTSYPGLRRRCSSAQIGSCGQFPWQYPGIAHAGLPECCSSARRSPAPVWCSRSPG